MIEQEFFNIVESLSKYKYGYLHKNNNIVLFNNDVRVFNVFEYTSMIQNPEQLLNNRCGMCHDISTYLYNYLYNSLKDKYLIYAHTYLPEKNHHYTHSFILYSLYKKWQYLIIDPLMYTDSKGYNNKYIFDCINEAIRYRINTWFNNYDVKKYTEVYYYNYDTYLPDGINLIEWTDEIMRISNKFNL